MPFKSTVRYLLVLLLGMAVGLVPWLRSADFARAAVLDDDAMRLQVYFFLRGDPNAQVAGGTLLMNATGPLGGRHVLSVLISHGANLDGGIQGYTALMNAASRCWLDGVKMLVKAGAKVRAQTVQGRTAVDAVCYGPPEQRNPVLAYLSSQLNGT